MDENKCFLCCQELVKHQEVIVKVLGLQSMIKASIERKDGKHKELKRETEIKVHRSCRNKYVLPSNIKRAAEEASAGPSTQRTQHTFNFEEEISPFIMDENKCFICCQEVLEHQQVIVKALGLQSLMKVSIERKDGKHEELKRKTEIKVHHACRKQYMLPFNIKRAAEEAAAGPSTQPTQHTFDFEGEIRPSIMDENKCFICCEEVLEHQELIVKAVGLQSLIKASIERNDGMHEQLKRKTEIKLHHACRKKYVLPFHIKKAAEEAEAVRPTRSTPYTFDFRHLCFICSEDASEDFVNTQSRYLMQYRTEVGYVNDNSIKTKMINFCAMNPNSMCVDIMSRIVHVPDLSKVGARYHRKCYRNLYNYKSLSSTAGRPMSGSVYAAFQFLLDYLFNNSDECQFSLRSILEMYSSTCEFSDRPSLKWMKGKLENHFESKIICRSYKGDVYVSFANVQIDNLTDTWYKNRLKKKKDEQLRIVKMAASITLLDIREKLYDTKNYKAPDNFLDGVNEDVPESLQVFLDSLIKTNKKENDMKWDNTATTLAHCIISAVRPRSFFSPILISLAAMMHKKLATKGMINAFSYLGLCASYREAQLFEASILHDPQQYSFHDTFLQFVFDNADHNTCTIDGLNAFHAMGGIMCATPHSSVTSTQTIARLSKLPSAEAVGKFGYLSVKSFHKNQSLGLKQIIIKNVLADRSNKLHIDSTDLLWLFSKSNYPESTHGWNGFMEQAFKNEYFVQSKIIPLPFVNDLPSKYDTIYTVLLQAAEKCKNSSQKHAFVTFDQPLYLKAKEIVACTEDDPSNILNCIILRLGGFHTLMSFMGSIGYLMNGSGLKEVLSEIYATLSVDKLLTGHVYARAVRAHIFCSSALGSIIFSHVELNNAERIYLHEQLKNLVKVNISDIVNSEKFMQINDKVLCKIQMLKENGPTAELWCQYFLLITLLKQFIAAERSGNWQLHLNCVSQMLPYFHATGHYLYVKCAHLYVQDMMNLREKMDESEYQRFTEKGFFTIRRSNKFWTGIWSDMAIEQGLRGYTTVTA